MLAGFSSLEQPRPSKAFQATPRTPRALGAHEHSRWADTDNATAVVLAIGQYMYAIKTEVADPGADSWTFEAQKTMYGGKHIDVGDEIFVFASENEGGVGLVASGTVSSATPVPRRADLERQTPRVSITIKRTGQAKRRLGRAELKAFSDWRDERPETELNFKFYRQATNKIVGLSAEAATFLRGFF